jgi:ribosome-binding factor A
MRPIRKKRIASFLRAEIARVILHELRDPRIGFVSVLSVEPTEDLKEAKVSVSILGNESEQRTAIRGLQAAAGFIQSHLARVIQFRETPQLRFILDDTIRRTMELEARIRQVRAEDEGARDARHGGQGSGQRSGEGVEEATGIGEPDE